MKRYFLNGQQVTAEKIKTTKEVKFVKSEIVGKYTYLYYEW